MAIMSRSKALVRALAGRREWYGIPQIYTLSGVFMAKIRILYSFGCRANKKKIHKKLTLMVAKEKTAVYLTYKPTTKPQNHEQPNLQSSS
jgi:hypothetical protein